jgi:hypothetical protein
MRHKPFHRIISRFGRASSLSEPAPEQSGVPPTDSPTAEIPWGIVRNKSFWLTIFEVGILLIALASIVALIGRRLSLFNRAAGSASLALPANLTATAGQSVTVPLTLNTGGQPIRGVDVFLIYDPAFLSFQSVVPKADASTGLLTFLPLAGSTFTPKVVTRSDGKQELEFGAVTFDQAGSVCAGNLCSPYTNSAAIVLATVNFTALNGGNTTVSIDATPGETRDTNVVSVDSNGVPSDILGTTTDLSLTISSGSSTPTPTGSISPSPSPTPPLTGTPTPSPTSSPVPGGAVLNLSMNFQGLPTGVSNHPQKILTVTLKTGSTSVNQQANIQTNWSSTSNAYTTSVTGLPAGTYDVFLKAPGYLQKKFPAITFSTGTTTQNWATTPLMAGDFNGDNTLNIMDISAILAKYTALSVPVDSTNSLFDVDGNNIINISDIALILANYTALSVPGDN